MDLRIDRRVLVFVGALACLGGCGPEESSEPADASTGASSESGTTPPGLSVNEMGATIEISDAWKACQTEADCVLVWTSCDGCCGQEAIATSREQEFDAASPGLCADYEGGVCDCAPLPTTIDCVASLCTLVPDEE